jgi:hypothetical protein
MTMSETIAPVTEVHTPGQACKTRLRSRAAATAFMAIAAAACLAGCGGSQTPPPPAAPTPPKATPAAPPPSATNSTAPKSTAQGIIEDMTGKTTIDQGRKAQDKIRAISNQHNKDLDEVSQ